MSHARLSASRTRPSGTTGGSQHPSGPVEHGLAVICSANALPFSIAPAVAPFILAVTDGNYGILYAVAGGCALLGAAAIMPVRRVR